MKIIELIENSYNKWTEYQDKCGWALKSTKSEESDMFSISASGGCFKKNHLWLEVDTSEIEREQDMRAKRLLRLGDLWHEDLRQALHEFPPEGFMVLTEQVVFLKELNLKGHFDILLYDYKNRKAFLVDNKTISVFSYSKRFGHKKNREPSDLRYERQIATYAMAIEETLGLPVDSCSILFYRKNDSAFKEVVVSDQMRKRAEQYWQQNLMFNSQNAEIGDMGFPFASWECKYCPFFGKHCKGIE